MSDLYKLGVIGTGHMSGVMLDGAVEAGILKPGEVFVYDISPARMEETKKKGYHLARDMAEVYTRCSYLLLAVPPQSGESVLKELQQCNNENNPFVLSIVSGMGSAFIKKYLGSGAKVVNIVPNLPISVGFGAIAVSRTPNVPDDMFCGLLDALKRFGRVVNVEEHMLKEIIPANGCGPGYAFYMIDAVASACAKQGVDYGLAVEMAAAAFAGAAKMLLAPNAKSPKELISQVCTPGGLTEKGINHFESMGLFDIIAEGAAKSAKRGHELALG